MRAIQVAKELAEENEPTVANKAVQLYAWVLQTVHDGGELYVRLAGEERPRQVLTPML